MEDPVTFRENGFGKLAVLPDYLLSIIVMSKSLGIESLATLCCCSRAMTVFCSEEILWQQHCLRLEHADSKPIVFQVSTATAL